MGAAQRQGRVIYTSDYTSDSDFLRRHQEIVRHSGIFYHHIITPASILQVRQSAPLL